MSYTKYYFHLILILLFLSGCVFPVKKVATNKMPDPKMAYVYGNFEVNSSANTNLSIVLKEYGKSSSDEDSGEQEYYIAFNTTYREKVDLIAIPPGKYDINKLANLQKDMTGFNKRGTSYLFKTRSPVIVSLEANKLHYLGDYSGSSDVYCTYPTCNYSWKLTSIDNTIKDSTQNLKTNYAFFKDMETKNLLNDIVAQLRKPGPYK